MIDFILYLLELKPKRMMQPTHADISAWLRAKVVYDHSGISIVLYLDESDTTITITQSGPPSMVYDQMANIIMHSEEMYRTITKLIQTSKA